MALVTGTDIFVGREREIAELTAALDGALEGRGALAMLAGQPGIGKTRLATELTAIARDRGAAVVSGACYEGGGTPPYWPWTQAIRTLLTEPSETIKVALGPKAAVMAEIVPEIGDVLPQLGAAPEVGPEQARFRLFDSITSFLTEISISKPMVILLDDLHWADRATLDLLEFISRDIATKPLLIIGGYRDMELSRGHPLAKSLATLARTHGFRRILLRGLGSDEVSRMVEAVGSITLPSALVEQIHLRTEGNPFFVGEVTRDLSNEAVERGGDFDALKFRIPEGVREAVGARLDRLTEECNQVLRIAAVIGREFEFALLAVLSSELADDALLDLVEEAIDDEEVEEASGPGERYEFSHALIQQTLAEELSTGRRVRLHSRIVSAIEELYTDRIDDHVAALAHHSAEAETVVGEDKLTRYSLQAGEEALRGYAFEEAIAYFERGLEARDPENKDRRRADLLFGIGRAQAATLFDDDLQVAVTTLINAFDIYDELGDSENAITVAEYPIPSAIQLRGVVSLTERALALVPEDSHAAGRLLSRHGLWISIEQGDYDTASRVLEQALAIARRESDQQLEMWSSANLASCQYYQSRPEQSFENARLAAELAEGVGDLHALAQARQFQAHSQRMQGDFKTADKHAIESVLAAERLGSQHRLVMAIELRARIAAILGDWDGARVLIDRGLTLAPTESSLLSTRVLVEYQCGDISSAEPFIEKLFGLERITWINGAALSMVLVAYLSDRKDLLAVVDTLAPQELISSASVILRYTARAILGLAAVVNHDQATVLEHYGVVTSGPAIHEGQEISAEYVMALLARASGDTDSVESHFEAALKYGRRTGARPALAWACADYAETLLINSGAIDLPKVEELVNEGMVIANNLGMKPLISRFAEIEGRLAVLRDRPAFPDSLTAREVEVLRLLAAGHTNKQIADELVIAINTVTTHVANILGKTGSANRTEAAAYATQNGLVEV